MDNRSASPHVIRFLPQAGQLAEVATCIKNNIKPHHLIHIYYLRRDSFFDHRHSAYHVSPP